RLFACSRRLLQACAAPSTRGRNFHSARALVSFSGSAAAASETDDGRRIHPGALAARRVPSPVAAPLGGPRSRNYPDKTASLDFLPSLPPGPCISPAYAAESC